MDMLRFHKFTIGWAWTSDYGSADNADEFKALVQVFAAAQPEEGHLLSATMITTADHDDRVVPAHSFKFAATAQADQAVGRRTGDHPHRHQGGPRRRQADHQADRGSGGQLGLPAVSG
jgi:prolyl oligopeptidase